MWGEDTMKKMILLVCSLLLSWNASALNLAGFHLPEMVSTKAIIDQSRENRIVLHILRELTGEKLYGAFREGIEANNDVPLAIGVQMEQIFEAVEVVKKGMLCG